MIRIELASTFAGNASNATCKLGRQDLNFLSVEVFQVVSFAAESGGTKKMSYIKTDEPTQEPDPPKTTQMQLT